MSVVALALSHETPSRFGPAEALDLAILGVTGRAAVDFDTVVGSVQSLGDVGWCPCADAVLEALEGLLRRSHTVHLIAGRSSQDIVFGASAAGVTRLRNLLRIPLPTDNPQLMPPAVALKVAFLDYLSRSEQMVCIDAMIEALERHQARLPGGPVQLVGNAPHLTLACGRKRDRLAEEIAWLWSVRAALI